MARRMTKSLGLLALFALALASDTRAEELVIAFSLNTPPYVMDEAKSGIGPEIVRAALKPKGYTFTTRQMSYRKLADAVVKKGVDAATMVIKMDNGTYYSDKYITFRNCAITKKSSDIKIDTIADLKGKSIVAWENAYEVLGPEFQALFSPSVRAPYRKKYMEIADQKEQVEMFWKGEAEVIVIDESVMRYFTKELAGKIDVSQALDYHKIFPPKTHYRISFKSRQVRDDFNAGLEEIRLNGVEQEIYDKYLK